MAEEAAAAEEAMGMDVTMVVTASNSGGASARRPVAPKLVSFDGCLELTVESSGGSTKRRSRWLTRAMRRRDRTELATTCTTPASPPT